MSRKIHRYNHPFALELGGELPELEIAYDTYGELNEKKDNVVWVCHALTANSDVADWWPHTIEEGCFLDPKKWFIICANIIGSHYGSTGPLSINPKTGKPYYGDFPRLTIRDMARAHALLANELGISKINTLVGSSVGGFQALEWITDEPERFGKLILIATDAKASPWSIAIDQTQRMAIFADSTYGKPNPQAGMKGLAAARAIGLLTYRGPMGYNRTQQDLPDATLETPHRASTYQDYQGEKLCKRFNAYSYVTILDAFDTHDVGRDRGGLEASLKRICCPTIVIGLTSDIIFTPEEQRTLAAMIPGAEYREIDSPFGHDGFLVEHGQLNAILNQFMK